MPHQPRFVLVGYPQHVIIRENNRGPIFYADEDYRFIWKNYMQPVKSKPDPLALCFLIL